MNWQKLGLQERQKEEVRSCEQQLRIKKQKEAEEEGVKKIHSLDIIEGTH